jgi:ATP-dependent helicase/nuclease subunit A
MSTPNLEQAPAIQHAGGVLLKAGAGSGKTFVLVEHVIHRTRLWRQEWESKPQDSFSDWIGTCYSSTVLMTFTKLAAGEILVRLTSRFQLEVSQCPHDERVWWQECLEQIERLTVTTIDGFFYKLVRRGFFPQLPPDVAIVMSAPRRKKILGLFDAWWEREASRLSPEVARDTAMYRTALAETLLEIFNDPSLRDSWMSFKPEDAAPEKLGWLAEELSVLEGWHEFLSQTQVSVPEEARAKANKWVVLADALNARAKSASTWDEIVSWGEFAASEVGSTRLNLGNSKELVGEYFDLWRDFKGSVRDWSETYRSYVEHFPKRILPWLKTLHHLVRSVNEGLYPTEGLTYGDLEYHVLRGLRDPQIAKKVRRDFTYYVVDEFQDTSRVQYEVLQLLTQGEAERLFCVGDAKQAIYGFRGGELKVFSDVEKAPGMRTLLLSSNYRSQSSVVHFNNAFFRTLFPLGLNWEGHDPHAVPMEPQTVPETKNSMDPGRVLLLNAILPDVLKVDETQVGKKSPKWRTEHLHRAEAEVQARFIADRLSTLGEGTIAVLYKKLAPSSALMTALMSKGIGFTAQAKIPFKDDPISGILLALIDDHLGAKEQKWSLFMVSGYLHLLGVEAGAELNESCLRFPSNVALYGPLLAFDMFLAGLGITNGLHQNLTEVRELLSLGSGDLEAVALRLRAKASESWSADFRFGPQSHRVILQTSHGSKGLEYDVVLVAGLATNGRARTEQDWIGSLPGAALWVEEATSRKRTATPQLLFEKALKTQKDFAESKRLFYVACTRAKKELVLVHLQAMDKQLTLEKKSWAEGLEKFLESPDANLIERQDVTLVESDFVTTQGSKPFFHLNPLGLSRREGTSVLPTFGVTPELAVTRLSSLWECPRKFYFKQVLKLPDEWDDDDLTPEAWGGERAPKALSSSERGSAIHLALSQAVAKNFVLPVDWVNHPDRSHMEWALSELKQATTPEARLVSEIPMKFPLFGFMMTGIPDLVVHGTSCEIWDYKTGRRSATSELKYWQQLMMYAWGHWQTGLVSRDAAIVLRLCYVDGRELPSKVVNLEEVREALFPIWSRLSALDKIDETHCPLCPYRTICPR